MELKPEYLTGDVAGALFDPDRVRDLALSDFVMETSDLVLKAHDPTARDLMRVTRHQMALELL